VVEPATVEGGPPQGQWTYAAYLQLPDDGNRYEVIDGVLYVAPPPSPEHQDRLLALCYHMLTVIRERSLGRLFVSPIALLMPGSSPVQPDAFFLATGNPAHIDWKRHVRGVPDVVIEVASPSTAGYDRREKQDAYARAGVPEYWIVDPVAATIELLVLDPDSGRYRSRGVFSAEDRLPSQIIADIPYGVAELLG
jgi:Uma2 family endonuclease